MNLASESIASLGQLPVHAADRHRDRLTVAAGYLTIRLPAHERPTRQNVANCLRAVHAADPRSEVRHFG